MFFNNLTIYLFEKLNEYFLFFTIIISIITLILTLSIVFESKFNLSNIYFKNHLFQSITSESFLNWLFNSSNYIKKRFFNEFIYSLNQNLFSQKVKKDFFLHISFAFFYFRNNSVSKHYNLLMQKYIILLKHPVK